MNTETASHTCWKVEQKEKQYEKHNTKISCQTELKLGLAIPGVVKYGAALGFAADLHTVMTTELNELNAADNAVKAAKDDAKTALTAMYSVRDTTRSHATTVRDLAKRSLGTTYSTAFNALGFNGSFVIPYSIDRLLGMLPNMASYIAGHPTLAIGDLNVTEERTLELKNQLFGAKTAVEVKQADVKRAMELRDAKARVVARRLRMLLKDLTFKLTRLDTRWPEFSFNPPGLLATPDVPTNVIALLIGPTTVALKWDRAARAGHYRVWKKVVDVDEEFVNVGSPQDLDFAIEGLPANATVRIAVSAVNNGGESAKTEPVSVVTG